ncbi:Uncharacterised protein [Chlamydia trachomatis]|nr:Uncharacterised protein [Chlamydia trachomatis]
MPVITATPSIAITASMQKRRHSWNHILIALIKTIGKIERERLLRIAYLRLIFLDFTVSLLTTNHHSTNHHSISAIAVGFSCTVSLTTFPEWNLTTL